MKSDQVSHILHHECSISNSLLCPLSASGNKSPSIHTTPQMAALSMAGGGSHYASQQICHVQKALAGRRHVGIMQVEAVGNYAVRLQFDDLHGSGLFTWEALHDLGLRQEEHMANYLRLLKDQGLSRDPRRRRM